MALLVSIAFGVSPFVLLALAEKFWLWLTVPPENNTRDYF